MWRATVQDKNKKILFYEPFQVPRAVCNTHALAKLCDGGGLLLLKRKDGDVQ
ncbi:hypothetical protein [Bartonella queenslandensis]|uniref:hypothetical protein n=1 Tax=Bartonella queenslandensis TaxID=481138 RepID=UPI001BA78BFA|nr:hypothetical protein [Bartonella queenslandensis]